MEVVAGVDGRAIVRARQGDGYDTLNQVSHVDEPFYLGLTFTYDDAGNRIAVQDSATALVGTYSEDRTTVTGLTTSTYDAANRLTGRFFSGASTGLAFEYQYTASDQVSELQRYADAAAATLFGRDRHYARCGPADDADQPRRQLRELRGRVLLQRRRQRSGEIRRPDGDLRLRCGGPVGERHFVGRFPSRTPTTRRATAPPTAPRRAGNLVNSDANYTYTYDADGNRATQTSIADGSVWQFTYDAADQLTSALHYSDDSELLAQVTYSYDAWGNLIERTAYDGGMDVAGMRQFGQDGWTVSQDFWGNRLTAAGNSVFNVWADLDGESSLTARRFYGDGVDQLVARVDVSGASATGTSWYLTDLQGSVVGMQDGSSGAVVGLKKYDGFGNIIESSGTLDIYGYAGRPLDSLTGQVYDRAALV